MGEPRKMTDDEIARLLQADVVGHLATVDAAGYPHVTPLWFHWDGEAARMTSVAGRPHLARLAANSRACLAVDLEEAERDEGERPNRQVRLIGDVTLADDADGRWSAAISNRYLRGAGVVERSGRRRHQTRVVMELRPITVVAVASTAVPGS